VSAKKTAPFPRRSWDRGGQFPDDLGAFAFLMRNRIASTSALLTHFIFV
jgi:hypothetical protein